jgi:SPASM domain peptide maturase of grasp-with-spasm system
MKNTYFKLFANCLPVKGASRSTICDVQRTELYFIPNELYETLLLLEQQSFESYKVVSWKGKGINDIDMGVIAYITQRIDSNSHCGIIDPFYFQLHQGSFVEAQKYNSCLNRKLSIDIDGSIKNCPTLKTSYGKIDEVNDFDWILNESTFKNLWSINKDQIAICKDCEFRYVCTDCRGFLDDPFAKPYKCGYNPYTTTWENNAENGAHFNMFSPSENAAFPL